MSGIDYMIETTAEIGEIIQAQRKKVGLTQVQVSDRAGVHRTQVLQLEAGSRDARLSTLLNVGRAIGLEMMMIPRELVPAIEAMLRPATESDRPAFVPDEPEEDEDHAHRP